MSELGSSLKQRKATVKALARDQKNAKKRRKALVNQFKELKKIQANKNAKMLEQQQLLGGEELKNRFTANNRNLSIRERLSLKQEGTRSESALASIVKAGIPVSNSLAEIV